MKSEYYYSKECMKEGFGVGRRRILVLFGGRMREKQRVWSAFVYARFWRPPKPTVVKNYGLPGGKLT
jgi:hypothetical protein